jgi:hypothetical protein
MMMCFELYDRKGLEATTCQGDAREAACSTSVAYRSHALQRVAMDDDLGAPEPRRRGETGADQGYWLLFPVTDCPNCVIGIGQIPLGNPEISAESGAQGVIIAQGANGGNGPYAPAA